jgi:hypothetical protein
MKPLFLLLIVLTSVSFATENQDIIGRWAHMGSKGNIFGFNFRKDGTFVSTIDKKVFTSGRYSFSNDTLTIVEEAECGTLGANIKEISHLVFFAPDSFRIDVLIDSCEGRRKAVDGSKYGRVKR